MSLKSRSETSKGIVLGVAGAAAFGAMGFGVHCLGGAIPAAEVAFVRASFGFVALLPFVFRNSAKLISPGSFMIWMRSFAGAISVLCYFYNLQKSNVGSATTLADLSPAFVVLLSVLVLREQLTRFEALGVLLATAGTVWIHRGDFQSSRLFLMLVGIAGAACGAIAYISLRRASLKFSGELVVFCFSAVNAIVALGLGGPNWGIPTYVDGAIMVVVALAGLVGQLLMTKSYFFLPATIACGLNMLALLFGMLLDALLHQDVPPLSALPGYGVLVIGVYVLQIKPRPGKNRDILPPSENAA